MKSFNYNRNFKELNFRHHPELYQVGRGEQGVLLVEPYKSEILPFWRFRTPEVAFVSATQIYQLFLQYKKENDFVAMDMARKFLQMGYTRARRYANHPSGQKYAVNPHNFDNHIAQRARSHQLPQAADWKTNEKAQAAQIFYDKYVLVKNDREYQKLAQDWKKKYG